ncbi:receptor-like protein kinase BRI1-like 3 [Pyrus communis]|uniref:receptor-like protein kinase BRI1-like 3 n=1 Tax=Pyrus communis TaxID=23211 RepID=UPI0035C15751
MMGFFCFLLMLVFHFHLHLSLTSGARTLSSSGGGGGGGGGDVVELLYAFKESSVVSDPQGFLSDWKPDSSTPLCSWKGITCSSDGAVTSLNLSNAGLIGGLHLPHLAALPNLQQLHLQGNSFSGADLSVSNLTSCRLETVDLSSNNISQPLPVRSFLQGCGRLVFANLSRNSIPGGGLGFGASLLQLDISHNLVSNADWLTCNNLNLLNVSHNKLTGKLSGSFLSCKNVSTIDLSYNNFSGELPNSFIAKASASLKYLDLSRNNFSGNFSALDFGQCSSLTLLRLSHNALSGDQFPPSFESCQALETLDLSNNKLENEIPGVLLGNLKKLRQLFLGHNHFSGAIPAELGKGCGTLEELDISDNILSGELPSSFLSCTSLSFRCTTKGDVYSYGVILLELLSGKRPVDPSAFGDDNNLVGWAKLLQREKRWSEILDTKLLTQISGEAELYQYLRIAFECLDDRPFRRPTMIQVMAMFKELQVDSQNDVLDDFSLKETVVEEP